MVYTEDGKTFKEVVCKKKLEMKEQDIPEMVLD